MFRNFHFNHSCTTLWSLMLLSCPAGPASTGIGLIIYIFLLSFSFLSLREITLNLIIITKSLSLIKVNRQKMSDTLNSSLQNFYFYHNEIKFNWIIQVTVLLKQKLVYAISRVFVPAHLTHGRFKSKSFCLEVMRN